MTSSFHGNHLFHTINTARLTTTRVNVGVNKTRTNRVYPDTFRSYFFCQANRKCINRTFRGRALQ